MTGKRCFLIIFCVSVVMAFFDVQVKVQSALKLHKNGDMTAALIAYDELIPYLNGVNGGVAATIHSNRGALLTNAGNYELAKEAFSAAVSAQPENINAHFNLAVTLTSRLGEHLKALRHCATALRLDPQHVKSLHLMGHIMQELGRPIDANVYYSRAAEVEAKVNVKLTDVNRSVSPKTKLAWGNWSSNARRLAEAKVGEYFPYSHADREFVLECISVNPRIFLIQNLLSLLECDSIRSRATSRLTYSHVTGGAASGRNDENAYRTSENAWLATDELLIDVQRRLGGLLGLEPSAMSAFSQSAEELQVIRYESGGQFKVHQDSSTFHPRVLTLLIYLNNVESTDEKVTSGGTWFPFSDSGLDAGAVPVDIGGGPLSVEQANAAALSVFESCTDQKHELRHGLVTAPIMGNAVLFFNHLPSGELDARAVHAGLPVAARPGEKRENVEKWAANYWFAGFEL